MSESNSFQWPHGKQAAVSLSFDDARPSQIERGVPIMDAFGIKATFYTSIIGVEKRLDVWRQAIANGHEAGNHTMTHPCSGNFKWSRTAALENFTLEQMEKELIDANAQIETLVGVRPSTFAYPCGQKFVGRGEQLKSYVPVVARHFTVGRGFPDEYINDPEWCDLAQAGGVNMDCTPFPKLKEWIDTAITNHGWLILVGHDMGLEQRQSVSKAVLEETCRHLADPANNLWVDTVANVGTYIHKKRETH